MVFVSVRNDLNGGSQEVFSYRKLSGPDRSFTETQYRISTWEPLTKKISTTS